MKKKLCSIWLCVVNFQFICFPYSIWTFISLSYLEFYFPFCTWNFFGIYFLFYFWIFLNSFGNLIQLFIFVAFCSFFSCTLTVFHWNFFGIYFLFYFWIFLNSFGNLIQLFIFIQSQPHFGFLFSTLKSLINEYLLLQD